MARPNDVGPSSDAELLARFAGRRDESAFAEIVQRHGPLVWAVCRSGLSTTDADDAFQATFLILTKQAAGIRKPAALAGWLAGVARRVVRRVRIKEARRTAAEQRLAARPRSVDDSDGLVQSEWRQLLNEELHQLPEKYLLPMLLCYYQGLTNEEAARRLGVPHGTVCGRLSRARELLRRRLIRRGVTLSVGALTAGAAAPPAEALAATLAACGSAANAGANLTAPVLTLAEAVMNSIWLEKVRAWTIGLVAVAAVGGGVGGWGFAPAPATGTAQVTDEKQTIDPPALPPKVRDRIEEIENAGMALLNGKTEVAFTFLQDAVKKFPGLPPARVMLVRLYLAAPIQRADTKQLRAILEQAVNETPDHPLPYVTLAEVALSEGRVTEAVLDCQKAIDLSVAKSWTVDEKKDFRAQAEYVLAKAHNHRRDWSAARAMCLKLLATDPANCDVHGELAKALIGLGKPDDAFHELQLAWEFGPAAKPPIIGRRNIELPSSYFGMATLFSEAGDAKTTRAWFETRIGANPNWLGPHVGYAQLLIQQKDLTAAKRHVALAAKISPESADVRRLQKLIAETEGPPRAVSPNRQ
jgi:RNA polymerase sigma factor (sigma-70 family)